MKKIFISMLTLCALAASAQEEETTVATSGGSITDVLLENSNKELSFTAKNGLEVLPQKGDWGIGISASNPLDFVQGALSNGSGSSSFAGVNGAATLNAIGGGTTVYGKFFKNSHTAYRGWINSNTASSTSLFETVDDGANPQDANVNPNDKRVIKNRGVALGFGLEKRRGNGRVIGIYGAEAFAGFGQGQVTKYTYANEYSATNTTPSDAFFQNGNADLSAVTNDQRLLESSNASTVLLGARVFLGVEYFFAPKISLGGEFNFGINYAPSTSSYETVEYFDNTTNEVAEFTTESKSGSSLTSGTSTLGGAINLNFYF